MARRVIRKLPTIGRASRFEAFDPDAIDGDSDGIVQELTRFERPAVARTISGAMSAPFDINQPVPEIIDALINDPSLYDLAPQKIPSVIFDMAGGNRELFERSRIRNVSPKGQWSEKQIMDLVNGIRIEPSPDGIFTIIAPPVPQIRELIGFDGEFSNVRIPSPDARIRMYKTILENLKENKNERRAHAETISEKLYEKADNGMFLPRMEYNDMRESLGDQYMPGRPEHPFDAIYERFLRISNDMMFAEMFQQEYVQVMHDFYGHFGTGRGFDRHGEWANYLAMVHAAETVSEGDEEIIDQVAFEFFSRIMTDQLHNWEQVDEQRGISTAQEATRLIWEIIGQKRDMYIDRDTMRQIIGIDDPLTYSRPKTKSLSEKPETIRKRAVAYLHSMIDNNIVETGQAHSSFVTKKNPAVEEKSLRRLNRFDRFDPNAIDADGDGRVQDATRFERPGVSRPSRVTGAMARPRTMDERNKKIIEKYNSGKLAKEIAEELDMPIANVRGVLKVARKRGEKVRGPIFNIERRDEVIKLFDLGKNYQEIADELGLNIDQTKYLLRRYGGAARRTKISRTITADAQKRNAEIVKMFDSGSTLQEIVEASSLDHSTVRKVLKNNQRFFKKRKKKPSQTKPKAKQPEVRGWRLEAPVDIPPTSTRTVRAPKKKEPQQTQASKPKPAVVPKEPTSPIFIPTGIPDSDKKLLQDYDSGKSVNEIAKERNTRPWEILETLVKYRLPGKDGSMTVPRSSRTLKGSISSTPKPTKSIKDYVDDPQLDLDAEAVGKSIGFWDGWPVADDPELGAGFGEPSVNYKNHPVYSYDLETGKPVKILGLHSTSEADIESIIKSKKYEIRGSGNFGQGGNFSFDGDPYMAEAYGEELNRNSAEELEKTRRLVVRLELENPIVVNVGVLEPTEDTKPDNENEGGARKNRSATLAERQEEYIKQLGGTEKVRGLYKLLLDAANGGNDTPAGVKITFNGKPSPKQIKYYEEIVNGGEINMHSRAGGLATQELNLLARAAGHDGIVWINTPGDGAESSHVIVLDEDKIKVLGARPAYSKETAAYYGKGRDWAKYHEAIARRENSRKLTGSIRRPEPEVWEKPYPRRPAYPMAIRPSDTGSDSLYDEGAGPKRRSERVARAMTPNIERSQSILVDIAQELTRTKNRTIPTGRSRAKRKKPKSLSNRVDGLSKEEKTKYYKDRNDLIKEELLKGELSIAEISEIFEVTDTNIADIAPKEYLENKKIRGEERKGRKSFTKEKSKLVVADIKKGLTAKQLAEKYDVTVATIQKEFGDEFKKYKQERNDKIREEIKNGASPGVVANKYKVSRPTILKLAGDLIMARDDNADNKYLDDKRNNAKASKAIARREGRLSGGISSRSATPSIVPPQSSSARSARKSKISGSIGTKTQEDSLKRLVDIRETTKGLVAQDMQTLRERAVENYVQKNPKFIKRLALINNSEDWKKNPAAVNPDGTPMSKAEHLAMVNAEHVSDAQAYVSKRLNNYAPDFNPLHLQQMQYNVEMMYLASPELYLLAEAYGHPQFAILTSQEIIGKDGKPQFFPNSEVNAKNMPGAASGVTLMASGISAILPVDGTAFIPRGAVVNDVLKDPKLVLNGHWGLNPEFFIDRYPDDPLTMIKYYTEALMAQRMSNHSRPALIDEGSPVTTLRHEASHSIHNNALAKAVRENAADPKNVQAADALVVLSLLNRPSWQSAAGIDLAFVNMMLKESVSDYAASSPPEWLAETLSAALSPSRVTRDLLSFNQRAILAIAFPELSNYLTGSVWP
jgi:DNA-binding NarL/FixJ family response regulator